MSDWIDLFDGAALDNWRALQRRGPGSAEDVARSHDWRVASAVDLAGGDGAQFAIEPGTGLMVNGETGKTADLYTRYEHGDAELHVEFCIARKSNSGVYLQGQYEIQVRHDWDEAPDDLSYKSSGGIYGRRTETGDMYDGGAPLARAAREPGEWQTFEVVFRAPRFDANGTKIANARFERVMYNNVLVQQDFECTGPTGGSFADEDLARGPLRLQGDHGPVAFRRVRMRPLD